MVRFLFPIQGIGPFKSFEEPFSAVPSLFMTIQTANDLQVVSLRAKDITTSGFSAALFEQESLMDGHGQEVVGYLAVSSPSSDISTGGSGSVQGISTGVVDISGELRELQLIDHTVNGNWQKYSGVEALALQEEQSLDSELSHLNERVNLLKIGDGLFGLQVTSVEHDSCALRRSLADSDGDGLNDSWEMQFFETLAQGADDDYDNDALSNVDEYALNTLPDSEDSDDDTMDGRVGANL